jgi:hypothetical protein
MRDICLYRFAVMCPSLARGTMCTKNPIRKEHFEPRPERIGVGLPVYHPDQCTRALWSLTASPLYC